MNKFYKLLFFSIVFFFIKSEATKGQCQPIDTLIFGFNDPSGPGYYSGFLCTGVDSVGTTGPYGYYNGDGFSINLVDGSELIFSVDSCNGNPVSITISDSLKNIIPGAYSGAACPNSLNFTAPYTGTFYVVMNLNGTCNVTGNTLLGQVYAKIDPNSNTPDCPAGNVINDTICGAIPLTFNGPYLVGNTSSAYITDPLDAYIVNLGFLCSPPNNTLWYSYTAQTNIDTLDIWLTSAAGGGFHSWLAVFTANDSINFCNGSLSYIGCAEGANDGGGIDTVTHSLYGLLAGHVYYFMIDGYNGGTGEFSIALKESSLITSILQIDDGNFNIYPNPASGNVHISSPHFEKVTLTIYNSIGKELYIKKYDRLINEEINTDFLAEGLYILQIAGSNGYFSKKFQIIR